MVYDSSVIIDAPVFLCLFSKQRVFLLTLYVRHRADSDYLWNILYK